MTSNRKKSRSIHFVAALFALFSCTLLFAAAHSTSTAGSHPHPAVHPTAHPAVHPTATQPATRSSSTTASATNPIKEWTFMVFMAADNNLEASDEGDLNELESVGSTDKVNIVVQLDRVGSYSQDCEMKWKGTKRFYIKKDDQPKHVSSPAIQDLGEMDSAAPKTLIDFVTWAKKSYPAKRYALILWDHGSGWKDVTPDGATPVTPPSPESAINPFGRNSAQGHSRNAAMSATLRQAMDTTSYNISIDETSGTSMDIPTLGTTLARIKDVLGQPLDLIGFDACLMQMLEVACETAPYARYQVGSTDLEPENGWPYDKILESLTAAPEIDGRKLGQNIVSYYNASYNNGDQGNTAVVLSLLDLSKIAEFIPILNSFCNALKQDVIEIDKIDQIRQNALKYVYEDNVDLANFAELLKTHASNAALKKAAADLSNALTMNAATGLISANGHIGEKYKDAHGLSIYLPERGSFRAYQKRYALLALSKQTGWPGFLDAFETPDLPYIRIQQVVLQDQNRDGRIAAGEDVTALFTLTNCGKKSINKVNISFASSCKTVECDKTVAVITQTPQPGKETSFPGFVFHVASETPVNTQVTLSFQLTGEGIPPATYRTAFFVKPPFQTTGQVLLAYTDGFSPSPPVLQAMFKSAGIGFDTWDRVLDGNIKPDVLKRYIDGWVFLSIQDSSDRQQLAPDEIDALTSFLKGGGRLALSGQDLAFSLRDTPFLKDLCKVTFVQDDTDVHVITGAQSFLPNVTFQIYGGDGANNQKWPDEIDALPGGQVIMKFEAGARDIADRRSMVGPNFKAFSTTRGIKSSGSAGVAVNDGYRLLFFSFGVEAINAADQRRDLVKQIKAFLSPTVDSRIHDYAGASSSRSRSPTRSPTSRQYQDDIDMLSSMRTHILESVRMSMESDPHAAENALHSIEALPAQHREASADLEHDIRSLLEFQRQHGTVIPR
ncbi:MAG: hypothetical protein HQM09_02810 [Candidatus Riflebacteria bacterium]|nr:hypothetical protein [Candidatus Riflebacteria bacterium]